MARFFWGGEGGSRRPILSEDYNTSGPIWGVLLFIYWGSSHSCIHVTPLLEIVLDDNPSEIRVMSLIGSNDGSSSLHMRPLPKWHFLKPIVRQNYM